MQYVHWNELFLVGSPWFWLLLVAEAALLIGLIEHGKGLVATVSLAVTLALLHFLGDADVFGFAGHHPLLLVFGTIGYFALGTVWCVIRWWMYVREQRNRYDEARADFCHNNDLQDSIPAELQRGWLQFLGSKYKVEVRPRARTHKGRILMWMAYWPSSLFWTILNDPVRKACLLIYHHIHDYLQEISDQAFKGVEKDFPPDAGPNLRIARFTPMPESEQQTTQRDVAVS